MWSCSTGRFPRIRKSGFLRDRLRVSRAEDGADEEDDGANADEHVGEVEHHGSHRADVQHQKVNHPPIVKHAIQKIADAAGHEERNPGEKHRSLPPSVVSDGANDGNNCNNSYREEPEPRWARKARSNPEGNAGILGVNEVHEVVDERKRRPMLKAISRQILRQLIATDRRRHHGQEKQ